MNGLLIVAGYVTLVAVTGWPGVLAAALHLFIMAMAAGRKK